MTCVICERKILDNEYVEAWGELKAHSECLLLFDEEDSLFLEDYYKGEG